MKKIIGLIVFVVVVVRRVLHIGRRLQKSRALTTRRSMAMLSLSAPRVAGHVSEVLVEDGQFVKKGDVLVKLDPKDFEIAIERAKADLNNELAICGRPALTCL